MSVSILVLDIADHCIFLLGMVFRWDMSHCSFLILPNLSHSNQHRPAANTTYQLYVLPRVYRFLLLHLLNIEALL